MCLLFLSLDENPTPGKYAVVIANNRDEFWDRPTKLADFWPSRPDCISGLDEKPGKEGGTWMGLSTTGYFASLLNIRPNVINPAKHHRGHLVTNYLTSNDPDLYLKSVFSERDQYRGFNLVTLQIRAGWKYKLTFVSNWEQYYDQLLDIPPKGCHGFGNCRYKQAWKKVEVGKNAFNRVVETYGTVDQKEEFLEKLFQLLSDKTKHLPDELLESECKYLPTYLRQQRSAIFDWSPKYRCGTRTMTVILIDSEGNTEYIEKTLRTPVDSDRIKWMTSRYSFKMLPDS